MLPPYCLFNPTPKFVTCQVFRHSSVSTVAHIALNRGFPPNTLVVGQAVGIFSPDQIYFQSGVMGYYSRTTSSKWAVAHDMRSVMMGISERPVSVSVYSTRGGTSG